MNIPNMIDPSVPIGKDDSENVEVEKFGDPIVPPYEIPYHTDIMESFDGRGLSGFFDNARIGVSAGERLAKARNRKS